MQVAAATDREVVVTQERPIWGWQSIRHPNPAVHEHHFLPLMDIGCHAFDEHCPCGPFEDMPGSIIHNAYDGRQDYEQGGRKRH